jgi:heterodisulfide reductase subunit B
MKRKYALYPGCLMPTEQYAYELSVRETLPLLDIELVDIQGFSCCGEPMKSVNQILALSLAARNLAIAEKQGLNLFVPCPMCHLSLTECKKILDEEPPMKTRINEMLANEELTYNGKIEIVHTVDLLHDIIGIDEITQRVKNPLKSLKIAAHYGCHLIRPSEIGRPVDSENPLKIEKILKALGAEPVMQYPQKLDCCGAPLLVNLPDSALTKSGQKLQAIQEQGIQGLVTVCPWCHKMFDERQKKAGEIVAKTLEVPVVYLTQLLGVALGVKTEKLGFTLNQSPIEKLALGNGA